VAAAANALARSGARRTLEQSTTEVCSAGAAELAGSIDDSDATSPTTPTIAVPVSRRAFIGVVSGFPEILISWILGDQ